MVSLKERKKTDLIADLKALASKTALILDDSDLDYVVRRVIGKLDEVMFNPRNALFDSSYLVDEKGHTFVDVTSFNIDEVCRVYFAPTDALGTWVDPSISFITWLSASYGFNVLSSAAGYLVLQSNLNVLSRQMRVVDDWFLFPVNADGKQLLQIRSKPELFIMEYLPHISYTENSWYLYENEYQFVLEYARCEMFLRSFEAVASGEVLGSSLKTASLLQYWDKKQKEVLEDFIKSKIITALY